MYAILNYPHPDVRQKKKSRSASAKPEANKWRNDERARSGVPLFIVTRGSVSKLKSLQSSLTTINDRTLRKFIGEEAISWFDNPSRNALWAFLVRNDDHFTLPMLIQYAEVSQDVLRRSNKIDLPAIEAKNLWRLNLIPCKEFPAISGGKNLIKHLINNLSSLGQKNFFVNEEG